VDTGRANIMLARGTISHRGSTELAKMKAVGAGILLVGGLDLVIGNLATFKLHNSVT
jgi:hypothetical protein